MGGRKMMSLMPIDCGFDPRVHDMAVLVPKWAEAVRYPCPTSGEPVERTGGAEELAEVLQNAGYEVEVER